MSTEGCPFDVFGADERQGSAAIRSRGTRDALQLALH